MDLVHALPEEEQAAGEEDQVAAGHRPARRPRRASAESPITQASVRSEQDLASAIASREPGDPRALPLGRRQSRPTRIEMKTTLSTPRTTSIGGQRREGDPGARVAHPLEHDASR